MLRMSVQKQPSKGEGKDRAPPIKRKSQSGGEGKRKKVFAESMGTAHLIELSNAIADSQSSKLKERVDKAKNKARWAKEKRAQNVKLKTAEGAISECKTGKKVPLSKSSIRAQLLAKRREKTKRRKEARKAVAAATLNVEDESASQENETKAKRVSFA